MHEHGQPVALVAPEVTRAAERRDAALRLLEDVAEGLLRIRHRLAARIHHPARWQRLVVELVDLDLARRHRGRGHVELKGWVALDGGGEGEGVRAHDRLRREGGHEGDPAGGGGDHADDATIGRDLRVAARGAEVMRVEHGDDGDSRGAALLDGEIHRVHRDGMAERGVRVDEGHGRSLAHGLEDGLHVEAAPPELLVVAGQHGDAVGVDAAQVGLDHHLRRGVGMRRGHAPGTKHGDELFTDQRRGNSHGLAPGSGVHFVAAP